MKQSTLSWLSFGAFLVACSGSSSTSSPVTDGGSDGTTEGSSSTSSGGTSSGASTSSGTTSSSGSTTSSSSSGGNDAGPSDGGGGGDGGPVPGNPIRCPAVTGAECSSPDVCCYALDGGGGTCEAVASCSGAALGCYASSCMTGDVCCAGSGTGQPSTQCEAKRCTSKEAQLCTKASDCPNASDTCEHVLGDISVCRRAQDGGAGDGGGDAGDGG